ncbi:hypothetical protein [Mucilaginibacter aquaedulcis]|uniref:hypothetical protein n=1 Tax=Mucilaginibacter aquaedulcis TaxID=1187081 RepID=UPI0025B5EE2C|nr:hypothetical protein [Mucilaginibacter aquaedulcis]MDN3551487.1 hypothetical protein [Mucilaginibacter aquaedulcis]
MDKQVIESQVRMYMFDLLNTAKEHGFKGEDSWELSMVTNSERIKIQKDYYPTLAAKIVPEILLQVLHTIRTRLNQSNKGEQKPDDRNALNEDLNYLVAFNPKRPRS